MTVDGVDYRITNSWEEVLSRCGIKFKTRSTGVLLALCPIHNEKTPSIRFWPQSGRFKCHGCGAEGDKVRFVLAERFGWSRSGELSIEVLKDALEDTPWVLIDLNGHSTYPDGGTLEFEFMNPSTQGPAAEK